MSAKGLSFLIPTSHLSTFEATTEEVDNLMRTMGGDFASRQCLSVLIVLLKRIEALEARLDANGIRQLAEDKGKDFIPYQRESDV